MNARTELIFSVLYDLVIVTKILFILRFYELIDNKTERILFRQPRYCSTIELKLKMKYLWQSFNDYCTLCSEICNVISINKLKILMICGHCTLYSHVIDDFLITRHIFLGNLKANNASNNTIETLWKKVVPHFFLEYNFWSTTYTQRHRYMKNLSNPKLYTT